MAENTIIAVILALVAISSTAAGFAIGVNHERGRALSIAAGIENLMEDCHPHIVWSNEVLRVIVQRLRGEKI